VALGRASLDEALAPIATGELIDGPHLQPAFANGNGTGNGSALPSLHGGSLRVLPTGPIPPNAGEFAGSDALAHILAELRARFDTVLIDAPPALQVGDAMALSRSVDALFVITRMNVVRRPMLNELRRVLDVSPARGLGFVISGAQAEEGYDYSYGYSYGAPRAASEQNVEALR
jgi:receptor protein-tyrosine kinase